MKNNPIKGAHYLIRGLGLINKPGIRRFVVIPFILNILVFSLFTYLAADQFDAFLEWMLPKGWDWIAYLLWPLFVLLVPIVVYLAASLVANLIAAPFNGLLADAVEQHLTGVREQGVSGFAKLLDDLVLTMRSEVRKLGYILMWSIPIVLLMIIPGLNIAAPVLWVLFGAWMMAVQYADYPMANHGITFPEQRRLLAEKRMLTMGFGGTVTLALMVPLLNFLVIPTAVAGATALWVEHLRDGAGTTPTAESAEPAPPAVAGTSGDPADDR